MIQKPTTPVSKPMKREISTTAIRPWGVLCSVPTTDLRNSLDLISCLMWDGSAVPGTHLPGPVNTKGRFEAGTPPISQVIGLGEAIDYLQGIGMDKIAEYEHSLLEYGTQVLQEIEGLRLIGTAARKASILSFYSDQIHPHDMVTLLDQDGIAVRGGHHCAQPTMQRFKVPATSRASVAFYNTYEELDVLGASIRRAIKLFS